MKLSLAGVKLSGFTKLSLGAGGVLCVALLGLTLFARDAPTKTGPARADDSTCPDCGRPLTSQAKATGECLFCKMEDPTMQKKKKRLAGGGGTFQSGKLAVGMVAAFATLLLANVVVFIRGRWMQKKTGDELHYMNCHKCDRRVRYRVRQVGVLARCPSCLTLIRFPELQVEKGRWSVVKGWLRRSRTKAPKDSA